MQLNLTRTAPSLHTSAIMDPNATKRPQKGIRKAKTALRTKLEPSRFVSQRTAVRGELQTGLPRRLRATIRSLNDVRASDFDDQLVVDYLKAVTGTVHQTARRWVSDQAPGLPDLVSFAMICKVVGIDANWALGLTEQGASEQHETTWLEDLCTELGQVAHNLVGKRVLGDEMEPEIGSGDWVLINTADRTWGRSGTYLLQYKGVETLRVVETRIGTGYVLSCRNDAYGEAVVEDEAHAANLGIEILGRVVMKVAVQKL